MQTKTISIANASVLRLLQDMAAMHLITFLNEPKQTKTLVSGDDDSITAQLNAVYAHEDSSLPEDIAMAQYEMFDREPW
jgi:hypothetical protein